jgi:hypothetical protein
MISVSPDICMRMIEGVSVSQTQMLPSRLRANPFGLPVVAIVELPSPVADTRVTRPRSNANSVTSHEPSGMSSGASGNARSLAKITRFLADRYKLV